MSIINKYFNAVYSWQAYYKENFNEIFSGYVNKIYLIAIGAVNVLCWLFAFFIDSRIGESLLALHYNVDFGINLLGEADMLYVLPLLGLLILTVNFILLLNIGNHRERRFLSHSLFLAALIANLTLGAAMFSIYLVNFR